MIDNVTRRIILSSALISLYLLTNAVFSQETGDYIHYRLGVKYKSEKKYDEAIDEFRKVLAAYPDNYNAYMHLAEIKASQGQYRLVIYNLKKALDYNPGWGKAHKLLSDAYEKDGQLQKAIMELQQYLQSSDPAERDSIQLQINRLIAKVGGQNGQSLNEQTKSDSISAKTDSSKTESGAKLENKLQKQSEKVSTEKEKTVSSSVKNQPKKTVAPLNASVQEIFNRSVDLYNQKQYDSSLAQLRKVLSLRPDYSGAYYYAGLIRRRFGQNGLAKINFLKAIDYPDLGHNSYFYLGKIYGESKNYTEAIKNLSLYIQKTTFEEGKKEAQQLIEKLSKESSSGSQAVKKDTLEDLGPSETVQTALPQEKYIPLEIRIDSLLTMVTVDTLTDEGQRLLSGIKAFSKGDYDNAIKEFKKALVLYPSGKIAVYCIYNTGVCYFKLRLFKESENQFHQILDKFNNHFLAPKSLFLSGMTYLERDESSTAEQIFRKFIQNNRNHEWVGTAYEKLGDAYIDLEQPKKAADAYISASSQSQDYAGKVSAFFKLGSVYLTLSNSQRAIDAFQQAINTGEKHDVYIRVPDSYYRIGDEKYKMKDYKGSLEVYSKVTRKYPAFQETPWGLFQIGSIYKNLNQYQQAVNTFKDLIKKYPDDYWAKQAQWKIEDAVWENEYKSVIQ
jgi:tetratricopeptide (TPR) repeat protein